ncbi:glutamate receptor ionotropic, delta-1-like [Euwallacea fornicatus]|uniref:glutamate receptor ionotropic, delta-1-like n=1 Tax=Euwallacea fornicatus TaxID=995702 RepID=UPI00338FB349
MPLSDIVKLFLRTLTCWSLLLRGWEVASERKIRDDIAALLTETSEDTFDALLYEIIVKSLSSFTCMTIVSDPTYSALFQKPWFETFGRYTSYVMVNVEESEDLLAPFNSTQDSLIAARNDGCQMYVILMANGLQVGRLLSFGDRYRVLNTRAKYIVLLDNRLFEEKLHYLWKRIINVIFIKKHTSKKGSDKPAKSDWYELATVPFPINFGSTLVPRRLDIWTKRKFRKGTDLFKDKTADLKNETLRVVAFAHIPGTEKSNLTNSNKIRANLRADDDELFTGLEIEILDTISKLMNFQCDLYQAENPGLELWGRKLIGGLYTGLLGEMATTRADIALGDLYYIPYILNIMDLSTPYHTECLTFLTPESTTDISWKTLVLPFSPIMWGCVIVCLSISSVSFHLLSKFQVHLAGVKKGQELRGEEEARQERTKEKALNRSMVKVDLNMTYSLMKEQHKRVQERGSEGLYQFSEPGNSILYTYSMLLLVSLPKLPTGWSLRMLTGWYWLYCLLVVVAYRASMTAILSRPTPRVTIDSLQELIESKLTYGGWGEINSEFFKSSPDDFINAVRRNFEVMNNSEEALNRVAEGRFAFYENIYFLRATILNRKIRHRRASTYINDSTFETADPQVQSNRDLHIMKDCIINMPVSIGLQKNSPMKPRVDKLIRAILEAGLIHKWLNDVMQKFRTERHDNTEEGQKALMNLRKMYGALVVLGLGFVAGFIAFTGELLYYYNVEIIKPGYNKYSRVIIKQHK